MTTAVFHLANMPLQGSGEKKAEITFEEFLTCLWIIARDCMRQLRVREGDLNAAVEALCLVMKTAAENACVG